MLKKYFDKQHSKDLYLTTLFGGLFLSITFFILLLAVILDKDTINTIILSIFFTMILALTIICTRKRYEEYKQYKELNDCEREPDDFGIDANDVETCNQEKFLEIINEKKAKAIKECKFFRVFILIMGVFLCASSTIIGWYGYSNNARYFDIAVIIVGVIILIASIIASKFYAKKIRKMKEEID